MWVERWTSTQQPYVEMLRVILSLDESSLLNWVQTQVKTRFEKFGDRKIIATAMLGADTGVAWKKSSESKGLSL